MAPIFPNCSIRRSKKVRNSAQNSEFVVQLLKITQAVTRSANRNHGKADVADGQGSGFNRGHGGIFGFALKQAV